MVLLEYLRYDLPTADLETLLASTSEFHLGAVSGASIEFEVYNMEESWWRPDEVKEPSYWADKKVRGKWQVECHVAVYRHADRVTLYAIYVEEP